MRFILSFLILVFGLQPAISTPPLEGYNRLIQEDSRWVRSTDNHLWNFQNVYQPCVREVPDAEYPYRMWFFGWAHEDCNPGHEGCDSIYLARSKDLSKWEVYSENNAWDAAMDPSKWEPVLEADKPEARFYGSWHIGDPSVVVRDGKYYMAYSSTSLPNYRPMKNHNDGMLLCVMGAVSSDGIHWAKTGQPLLIEPAEVRQATSDVNWTGDFHRPSLLWDQGKWRLWFDYWHRTKGVCMGYAENSGDFARDGFKILNADDNPLIVNWPNPDVIRAGDKYYSFADPNGMPGKENDPNHGWTSRALCEAVSSDGIHWDILGFIRPDADSAACHVAQAFLHSAKGESSWLWVFYATQRGGSPVYDYRYDRIRAMRRRIVE